MDQRGYTGGAPVGTLPDLAPATVPPPGRTATVVRVLIAVGLVLGWANSFMQPVERSVDHLLQELADGRVTELTIERPPDLPDAQAQGQWRVEWSGEGRPGYAYYEFNSLDGMPEVDEGAEILTAADASPSPVSVTVRQDYFGPTGTVWHPVTIAALAVLLLLVLGPQPRLATKWAWFWLAMTAAPLWLVFVLLEPTPLGARRPAPLPARRLTGGWAFLISITLLPFALGLLPGYDELFR
ncbi:hypothetical protein [Georgenia subflava]|uniref:Uncharacterized protein n=1 Tax=Georgenia subflava TaxID=1622177 RepID=A0A6N7EM01_9MICO|nr:hypothetical protein [Georgenia subflava]MPV39139.1 hypothetical protein [Georgenia subflava]